jgi:hypothetical protein
VVGLDGNKLLAGVGGYDLERPNYPDSFLTMAANVSTSRSTSFRQVNGYYADRPND